MNRRISSPDASLNAPLREDGDGEWQDWLVDGDDDQEIALAKHEEFGNRPQACSRAPCALFRSASGRSSSERRLKDTPTTLESLSQRYGISRERVRQIEVRAFEKLQKSVRNAIMDRRVAC